MQLESLPRNQKKSKKQPTEKSMQRGRRHQLKMDESSHWGEDIDIPILRDKFAALKTQDPEQVLQFYHQYAPNVRQKQLNHLGKQEKIKKDKRLQLSFIRSVDEEIEEALIKKKNGLKDLRDQNQNQGSCQFMTASLATIQSASEITEFNTLPMIEEEYHKAKEELVEFKKQRKEGATQRYGGLSQLTELDSSNFG